MKKKIIIMLAGIFFFTMVGGAKAIPILANDTGVTYSWDGYAATHTDGFNMIFSDFNQLLYDQAYWSVDVNVFLDLYCYDNTFWSNIDSMAYKGISGNQATWTGLSSMNYINEQGSPYVLQNLKTRFIITSDALLNPTGWGLGGAAVKLNATESTTINVLFEVAQVDSTTWTAANTYYDLYNGDNGKGEVVSGFNADLYGEPIASSAVPEPTTMLLLGFGLLGLAGVSRKRLQK